MTFNGKELGAGLLKHILTGGGVTVGVLLAYAGYEIAKAQPQMVIELMRSWGAPAMLGAMAVVFMDRRIGQGMRLLSDNTRATQKMADAMSEIAHRDDNSMRETELTMATLVRQNEEMHAEIKGIAANLNDRAMSAGA